MAASASSRMRRTGVEQRPHLTKRRTQVAIAPSSDQHLARIGSVEAENESHRRGFAGTVRPDEPVTRPASTRNYRSIDGDGAPVPFRQTLPVDCRAHREHGMTACLRCRRAPEPSFAPFAAVMSTASITRAGDERTRRCGRRGCAVIDATMA